MKLKQTRRLKPVDLQSSPPHRRKVGWHANEDRAPHAGKGKATVSPIRDVKEITRIKAVLGDSPRDLSLFTIGIHAGLRGSDLLALRWKDVLTENGAVQERICIQERKTGNTRRIAIQPKARQILQEWKTCSTDGANREDYIWPGPTPQKPLSIQRLHQLVNEWCKMADVKGHYGTHTLRKTYGYHLRRLGHDIDLLMQIFGHSSARITLRYIGIGQEQIDQANLKLVL